MAFCAISAVYKHGQQCQRKASQQLGTYLVLNKCEGHLVLVATDLGETSAEHAKHTLDGLHELLVRATIGETGQGQRLEGITGG